MLKDLKSSAQQRSRRTSLRRLRPAVCIAVLAVAEKVRHVFNVRSFQRGTEAQLEGPESPSALPFIFNDQAGPLLMILQSI